MRPHQPMAQQMQPEIKVVNIERRRREIGDARAHREDAYPAPLVRSDCPIHTGGKFPGDFRGLQPSGAGGRDI